jgi:hypothetical protein
MAELDGEPVPTIDDPPAAARQHLLSCASCTQWLQNVATLNSRFQQLPYPDQQLDLWGPLEGRLRQSDTRLTVTHRLTVIGALVLGWRALQLLTDLPFPILHPIVPLAGAIAALWLIARDPLAIETYAPELQKGRV